MDPRARNDAVKRRAGLSGVARLVWFLAIVTTFMVFGIPFPMPLPVAAICATVGVAIISGGASVD